MAIILKVQQKQNMINQYNSLWYLFGKSRLTFLDAVDAALEVFLLVGLLDDRAVHHDAVHLIQAHVHQLSSHVLAVRQLPQQLHHLCNSIHSVVMGKLHELT